MAMGALITRAARRVISEDVLIFFLGPRPKPPAAAHSATEEEKILTNKYAVCTTRRVRSRYYRRSTEKENKGSEPLLAFMLVSLAFLEGSTVVKDDREDM